ncbi:hypothetical protein [Piscinibacter sp.]|uniref:hypothetical protein n=1 Tax=Piscinibacter sp. TaxID=1903157 RepID=UPI002BBF4A45|nr:hypothetical protein [Albitalea sp.]HUG24266.1 hypothetical protein [Albitalea sp.]
MTAEDKRAQRLQLLDDHIGEALRESERSGELESAPPDQTGRSIRCTAAKTNAAGSRWARSVFLAAVGSLWAGSVQLYR